MTGALKRRFRRIAEKSMPRPHPLRALADGAADAFHRSRAHIADGEHARHGGFQRRHRASLILFGLRASHHETSAVDRDAAAVEPAGGGISADEQEQIADVSGTLFTGQTAAPA